MNLEPLRRVRLERARSEAARILAEAEAGAEELRRSSAGDPAALGAAAADAGRADASAEVAELRSGSERQARELVLSARRDALDDLEEAVTRAVAGLASQAAYRDLRAALEGEVRAQLGPEAVITAAADGGVIGTAGARRVDYSLGAVARRVLASMPGEVEEILR